MRHSSSTLEALHRLSSSNRDVLKEDRECGCFHCLRTFKASEITKWIPERDGRDETALCPHCGVDSVLPARAGERVDAEILRAMQAYWFQRGVPLPGGPRLLAEAKLKLQPLLRRLTWDLWASRKDLH